MSKKYEYAVVIGRFSPFHNGHKYLIEQAFETADNVIVVIGSCDAPRNTKEPFTFLERQSMIAGAFRDMKRNQTLQIVGIGDTKYNNERWYGGVRNKVESCLTGVFSSPTIALVAHDKDNTSFYIHNFPDWDLVRVGAPFSMSATDIRDMYFNYSADFDHVGKMVPENVLYFLKKFYTSPEYAYLSSWFGSDHNNKKIWANSPYPVTIVCADAVVTHSGHILLIRRKNHPGKDLWAMPGGHIDVNERIIDSAVRELREETCLRDEKGEIPPAMVKSFIDDSKTKVYDDPGRSTRGRVITTAFHFELPAKKRFYASPADDAKEAEWFPISKIWELPMFEDHRCIISDMLGV